MLQPWLPSLEAFESASAWFSHALISPTALLVPDVKWSEVGPGLLVQHSKIGQLCKGCDISLGYCKNQTLRLLHALEGYLAIRGLPSGLLFCHMDGLPLAKQQFWAVTSQALKTLGLPEVWFCTYLHYIGIAFIVRAMGYPPINKKATGIK